MMRWSVSQCIVGVVVVVLAALLLRVNCTPLSYQGSNTQSRLARAIRGGLDLLHLKRSSEQRPKCEAVERTVYRSGCNRNSECYPPDLRYVPSSLISCDGHRCTCNDCFKRGSSGNCTDADTVCADYYYSIGRQECVDDRKSQLTAFLLSFFLGPTGAANFYIGQNGYGIGQLIILVLLIVSAFSLCTLPFFLASRFTTDDTKSGVVFIVTGMTNIIVVLLSAIVIWSWWLSDLIIFTTNDRDTGNGCSLREF